MRLKNILIVTEDIERAKKFYKDLFGLDVITDQEGNSVIGCYREDMQQAVFFEKGIYTFLLKAMDKERKSCTEKRCILIDCR